MRELFFRLITTVLGVAAVSCMASSDSVRRLLAQRESLDGQRVQVRGVLGVDRGIVNLFSADRNNCLGLLTYTRDLDRYIALDGQRVIASGTLDAEGCGRRGVCVERMCGPAILRDVTIQTAQ